MVEEFVWWKNIKTGEHLGCGALSLTTFGSTVKKSKTFHRKHFKKCSCKGKNKMVSFPEGHQRAEVYKARLVRDSQIGDTMQRK